ncbi:MAG: hypothetical protein FJ091_19360 [Deltaproteobacteria bacterium]|nr:hypothetical protein [Chloroflexota bacterium]MBM4385516.1 hypothetical protein [Deltaproteobacteria bacterium]
MDGEYRMIQNALSGSLCAGSESSRGAIGWAALLAAIVVATCVATSFTVGSGDERRNHVWSWDVVLDRTDDGRPNSQ